MKLFQLDRIFTYLCNTVFPALVKLTVVGLVFLINFLVSRTQYTERVVRSLSIVNEL